jgi:hypothetical protein
MAKTVGRRSEAPVVAGSQIARRQKWRESFPRPAEWAGRPTTCKLGGELLIIAQSLSPFCEQNLSARRVQRLQRGL